MELRSLFLNISDFELSEDKIGTGTYGDVFLAINTNNKKQYAAKIIKIQEKFEDYQRIKFLNESFALYKLNYPSILKFEGISFQSLTDPSQFKPTIITEFLPNKSLKINLESNIEFNVTKKYITLLGISDAMRYLHKHGIIHRDLKPDNILFDENFYPRVCDFGICKCFSEPLTNSKDFIMSGPIGTPLYMAPELIDGEKYSASIDVFSFGIIAYQIASGKEPYSNLKNITAFNLMNKVSERLRPAFSGNETDKMKSLISRCWNSSASKRPSFDEIYNELSTDLTYLKGEIDKDSVNAYIDYIKRNRIEIENKENNSLIQNVSYNNDNIDLNSDSEDDDEENSDQEDDDDDDDIKDDDHVINDKDDDDDNEDDDDDDDPKFKKIATFPDKNGIIYELHEESENNPRYAIIIRSKNAKGKIKIPKYAMFSKKKYLVTSICNKAFANKSLESISFSDNSMITTIGSSVFKGSQIKKIRFPKTLKKLNKSWCKGATQLVEVEIDPDNSHFSIENGFLVQSKEDKYIIIFPSKSLDLVNLNIECEKQLILSNYCFSNSANLKSIKISCNVLKMKSKCFFNCPSFESFEILKSTDVKMRLNTFNGCEKLENISFKKSDEIVIEESNFICSKNILKSVSFEQVKKVIIHNNAFKNFKNLQLINFLDVREIGFGSRCFYNCKSLSTLLIACEQDVIINGDTFKGCNMLEKITIKTKSILEIPDKFMFNSTKLKSVTFKGEEVKLGEFCFENCTSLEYFSIFDSGKIELGENIFKNCPCLLDVTIGSKENSPIEFGRNCFSGAINMKYFKIQNGKVIINNNCLESCKSLINLFIIKASEIIINDNQLVDLKFLTNVILESESKIVVGQNCFSGSPILKKAIFVGETILISNFCFMNKTKSESTFKITVKASSDVTLSQKSFFNSNIEKINITSPNITLYDECFSSCSYLKTFNINEASIFNIGSKVFYECPNFELIDITSSEQINVQSECFIGSSIKSFKAQSKKVTIGANSFKDLNSICSVCINSSDIELGNGSFENCTNINAIELGNKSPEDLEIAKLTIGDFCFSGAISLTKLKLQGSEIDIGKSGFSNCILIKKIKMKFNKVTLHENAFTNCKSIKKIKIKANTEFFTESNCFSNLINLNSIMISSSIITIGDSCFFGCLLLKTISFSDAMQIVLGGKAFESCNSVEKFNFEATNEFQGKNYCFSKSTSFHSIRITSEKITIGDYGFSGCSSLSTVFFYKANEITFGEKAFELCDKLGTFDVASKEKFYAGPYCFSNLKSLSLVQIGGEIVTIDNFCISGCNSLKNFSINNTKNVFLKENAIEKCNILNEIDITADESLETSKFCISNLKKLNIFIISCPEIRVFKQCFEYCPSLDYINCKLTNKIICSNHAGFS